MSWLQYDYNPDLVDGCEVVEVALGPGEDAPVVHVDVTHRTVEPAADQSLFKI